MIMGIDTPINPFPVTKRELLASLPNYKKQTLMPRTKKEPETFDPADKVNSLLPLLSNGQLLDLQREVNSRILSIKNNLQTELDLLNGKPQSNINTDGRV